jgi:hypothetical protein
MRTLWIASWRPRNGFGTAGLVEPVAHETTERYEAHWNQEHAKNSRAQHPTDDAGANGVAGICACATRDDHGKDAEDECE